MKTYFHLFIAIAFEIFATTALKRSEQFTKFLPSACAVLGYSIAFYFLSLVMKRMDVGIAYALWSALGIVALTIIGAVWFKQKPDAPALIGMALIVIGVVIIQVFSKSATS